MAVFFKFFIFEPTKYKTYDTVAKRLKSLNMLRNGFIMLLLLAIFLDFTPKDTFWVYLLFVPVFIAIRIYELKLTNELYTRKTLYITLFYLFGFGLLFYAVYFFNK